MAYAVVRVDVANLERLPGTASRDADERAGKYQVTALDGDQ